MTTRRWLTVVIAAATIAAFGGLLAGRRTEAATPNASGTTIAASDAQLLWGLLQLHEATGPLASAPPPSVHACRRLPASHASRVTPDGWVELPSSRKDTS